MYMSIQIDDILLQEAFALGGQQTAQALLLEALREYIQRHRQPDTDDTASLSETRLIEQDGLLFIEGALSGDISNIVQEEREARLAVLLERCES